MAPTMPEGALALVFKRATPEVGDIVMMRIGDDPARYLKRVVAVEGERVAWSGAGVTVDGDPLATGRTDQATLPDPCAGAPIGLVEEARGAARWWATAPGAVGSLEQVPAGHVFVLGDWRDGSRDSRHWGPVSSVEIEGVVQLIIIRRPPCEAGGFPLRVVRL